MAKSPTDLIEDARLIPRLRRWPAWAPCPALTQRKKAILCSREYASEAGATAAAAATAVGVKRVPPTCSVFQCKKCHRATPWCFGSGDSDLCDGCAT